MKENVESLPLVLMVDEASQVLRIGKTKTYELVRSGQLHSLRVGRKIRVPRRALLEFLDSST